MSVPIASFPSTMSKEDTTGSIPEKPAPRLLDSEDWHSAEAAFAGALEADGDGSPVTWENSKAGSKGFFASLGQAYPSETGVCRAFLVRIDRGGEARSTRGTACSAKGGEWTVSEAAPWQKG